MPDGTHGRFRWSERPDGDYDFFENEQPQGIYSSLEDIDGEIAAREGPATLALLKQARDALRILNDRYGHDSGANLGTECERPIADTCDDFDSFLDALVNMGELSPAEHTELLA